MKVDNYTRFTHCHSDGIRQEQPDNTHSDGLGWTVIKSAESKGYLSSIRGNDNYIDFPSGYKLRGEVYLPEFDMWIFLGLVGSVGEVGVGWQKTKTYQTIVTDGELDRPLGLKDCVWTKMEVNIHANCNRLKIHFTTNKVYRVIELFDPCRDFSNTLLFKPTCIGVLSVTPVKGLGRLVNGSYAASLKVFDKDLNDTNFNLPSNPVNVSDGDHRIDEETKYGLVIEGHNLPRDYNMAELVICENITGAWKYKVINDVPFADGYFSYTYTGAEGYYADDKLADINNLKQQYFEGDGIDQHDNTLLLDDIMPQRNYNLQKYVNNFKVGYKRWLVPLKEAEHYRGLRENENYAPCIWYNGKDGTRTISFPMINPNQFSGGTIPAGGIGNCTNCDLPEWATQDTSIQTKLYTAFDLCTFGSLGGAQYSNNLKVKINPEDEVNKKIYSKDGPLSFQCNGSCAEGRAGGSCYGGSCGAGANGSDGVLPRSKRDYDQNLVDESQPEENTINNDYGELCETFSCDKTMFRAALQQIIEGLYAIANAIREAFSLTPLSVPNSLPNCTCQVYEEYKSFTRTKKEIIDEDITYSETPYNQLKYLETNYPCTTPGERVCVDQICYECIGGKWHYMNNVIYYKHRLVKLSTKGNMEFIVKSNPITEYLDYGIRAYALTEPVNTNPWGQNCIPELTPPIPYSEGLFGYWETNERYPVEIGRDDCLPIFREYAGRNEILCKVPSLGKEPNFLSFSNGVPSKQNMGHDERQDGYAVFTGLRVWDILIPDEIKDWVCKKNPFTIGYAQRKEVDKTVVSTGILHGTFEGQIQGDVYQFPKHGVNSFEFYDANINPGGTNTLRRGSASGLPAYTYHSPDFHLYGNNQDGHYALYQLELFGKGYRHGLYADGKKPDKPTQPTENQCGVRQGLSLNKYICRPQPIIRCIKGMTEAPANTIVGRDGGLSFTRSLVNLQRETSQYIEFEGNKVNFTRDADGPYGSLNGGDAESDNSFIGDTINHETFVKNNRAHLVTIMRYVPNQYGPIISRPYIPIGLNGTNASFNQPNGSISIEGIVGDSFIGPFTYKRTGHVSDKVPERITTDFTWGLIFPKKDSPDSMLDEILEIFQEIVDGILDALGLESIGTTPTSGDRNDNRNLLGGLRNGWNGMTDESSAIGPPSAGEYPDTFMPQLIKSYIFSVLSSDANLNYRGTGSVTFGEDGVFEVHRFGLKGLNIDSTMPDGNQPKRGWLNKPWFLMIEPSRWKLILRVILNFVFAIGIGLWIIFEGIGLVSFDTSGILGLIGAVFSIIAAIFIIAIGVVWIRLWMDATLDNRVIDFIIGMEWTYPDKIMRDKDEAGLGTRWAMFGSRIRGFEDNYFYYNNTLSQLNGGVANFAMPYYYDTEYCPNKYTNRIIASLRQNSTSEINAWRQFKPLHYLDVPRNRGKIMDIITLGQKMYIQTTDTIFQVSYNGDSMRQLNSEELLLGRFYLFGKSIDVHGGVVEGASGTKDPNASRTTIYGHFYVDRDARRFKVFTGGDQSIPTSGIEEYMDDNIKFHILDYVPDYPYIDQKCPVSVYFEIALDHGNNMIYFMKKDFIPKDGVEWNSKKGRFQLGSSLKAKAVFPGDEKHFIDKSFMWIYNMRSQKWISREFLRPDVFLQDRYSIFSVKEDKIWTHDTKGIFNNFFGVQYPYYIEIPITDERFHNSITLRNFKVVGEIIDHFEDGSWKESDERTFEAFMIYNGRQNSGWIDLREVALTDDENLVNHITETEEARWYRKGNGTMVEEFRSHTSLNDKPLDTEDMFLDIKDIKNTRMEPNGTFEDDYFVLRLFFNKKKNQEIHLRKIIFSQGPEQDG